jgi:hypothetical protein
MASPPCMIEECESVATFTGTFFESGLSVVVCGDHFIDFAAGTLEAMTGVPITALITLPPETFEQVAPPSGDESIPLGPTSPESSEVGTASDPDAEWDKENETYEQWVNRTIAVEGEHGPHGVERGDTEADYADVTDGDDISRDSIADKLDAKHADITDAEFNTPVNN